MPGTASAGGTHRLREKSRQSRPIGTNLMVLLPLRLQLHVQLTFKVRRNEGLMEETT